ncbi:GNAT family N-acetyltransferase [Paenibacillus anaericanus]|uniref:GNAT family N-acetyltransferase n=1 Tax=Paenibacillus anaericanus TaxID=170367 RepID=A0A3S1DM55_9BACL|nr:GNAT family N-acetyltransferase [Paenibacillus anaericanus]RUT44482.1 GNAT family N-acetyltransferase [Paenibacillus anaericanus]
MSEVKITPFDSKGLLQLKDLDCFPLPIERDSIYIMFYRFFRNTCRLAYINEELVGFVLGVVDQTEQSHVYIHYLFVKEEHRGQHIGIGLMNELIHYLRNNNYSKVTLMTGKDNEINKRFYSRLGFKLENEINEELEKDLVINYILKDKKMLFFRLDL